MSDPTSVRQIEDSHFVAIAQALVSGASEAQCEAVKNLLFWRQRDLKQKQVQEYRVGDVIRYYLADSLTEEIGTIHHLNKLSVSIHRGNGQYEAIPIERVIGLNADLVCTDCRWRAGHAPDCPRTKNFRLVRTGEHSAEVRDVLAKFEYADEG